MPDVGDRLERHQEVADPFEAQQQDAADDGPPPRPPGRGREQRIGHTDQGAFARILNLQ